VIFGASTFSFIRQEVAITSMRRLRRLGYRHMDILAVPGHLWPPELDARARNELRRSLERDDIVVDSINPQPVDLNIGSALTEVRVYSIAMYTEAIRLATELGARAVVVVPGRVSPKLPPRYEDTLRWTADSVATLSDVARETGLEVVLLESHPTTGVPTATALGELLDAVDADNVKVAYDVANAEFIGEDQIAAIRMLGERIGQTHLSDARSGVWAHDPIGEGTVRFQDILTEVDAAAPSAMNIVEIISEHPLTAYEDAARALEIPLVSRVS